jgi:hypothetical protein
MIVLALAYEPWYENFDLEFASKHNIFFECKFLEYHNISVHIVKRLFNLLVDF